MNTEGIFLKEYPRHLIRVRTQNTLYEFVTWEGKLTGRAFKPDGSTPRYFRYEMEVSIHGSTWGGSAIKPGYIGVGMYLEFSDGTPRRAITTSEIQSIDVAEVFRRNPLEVYC